MSYVFAADIGGTNMRFAIVNVSGKHPRIVKKEVLPTKHTKHFHKAINTFLAAQKFKVTKGAFSVAGPVSLREKNRSISMTNANLIVDEVKLRRATSLTQVKVLNDFEAVGYATTCLPPSSKRLLRKRSGKGPYIVVGPGTGLGVGLVIDGKPERSEGCHADLPIREVEEYALLAFLRHEEGWSEGTPITYEDVLSGPGLERLYKFHRYSTFKEKRNMQYRHTAMEISKQRKTHPCAKATFSWFERFLGRRCKNLALDTYATGGIWLAGGILAKNPDVVGKTFFQELSNHHLPQFKRFLDALPVTLITDENAGLLGAAASLL